MKIRDVYNKLINKYHKQGLRDELSRVFNTYDLFQQIADINVSKLCHNEFIFEDFDTNGLFIRINPRAASCESLFEILKNVQTRFRVVGKSIIEVYHTVGCEIRTFIDLVHYDSKIFKFDLQTHNKTSSLLLEHSVKCTECGKYINDFCKEEYKDERCNSHTIME